MSEQVTEKWCIHKVGMTDRTVIMWTLLHWHDFLAHFFITKSWPSSPNKLITNHVNMNKLMLTALRVIHLCLWQYCTCYIFKEYTWLALSVILVYSTITLCNTPSIHSQWCLLHINKWSHVIYIPNEQCWETFCVAASPFPWCFTASCTPTHRAVTA